MASSMGFHESESSLAEATKDRHRAIVSVSEELEAIDWDAQRIDAAGDGELAELLAHNRDEEKEHAAMLLEWLRRRDDRWDAVLRTYLFTDGPIRAVEEAAEAGSTGPSGPGPSGLGIGSLRGGTNL